MSLLVSGMDGHTVLKQSYPHPARSKRNKKPDYIEKLRNAKVTNSNNYGDRFEDQDNKMMKTSNGYFVQVVSHIIM